MNQDSKCAICGADLYSITTRNVGEYKICRECGDQVLPAVDEIVNSLVQGVIQYVNEGQTVSDAVYLSRGQR